MIDFNGYSVEQPTVIPQTADSVAAFEAAMADAGYTPGQLIADGTLQRFDIDKRGDKAGWYCLYQDGIPAGVFGNWKTGDVQQWCSKHRDYLTPIERTDFNNRIAQAQARRAEAKAVEHDQASIKATRIWQEASPAPDDHPYLQAKQVKSYDLKVNRAGQLILPVSDSAGVIWTLQTINPDGTKRFLPGGAKRGNYFTIPGDDKVFICEGYATGASIHHATGGTVIVAFDAGNLKPVAEKIAIKQPGKVITICADNDRWTDGNPGVKAAREAAAGIGARVVIPEFTDLSTRPTDFNDLSRLEGTHAIKKNITAKPRLNLYDWTADIYPDQDLPYEWLVANTIPLGAVSLLAAMGGAGKGMLTTHLALCVARGETGNVLQRYHKAFGNDVVAEGSAVIFTAEDTQKEVNRRLINIDREGARFKCARRLIIVPLPNAGGPMPLVLPGREGPQVTPFFHEVREALTGISDLRLIVFDPMASFVYADINADPAVGAYTTGLLSSLAVETNAAIIINHHLGKGNSGGKPIDSAEQARALIRGTTAIVDGVRAAYVMWAANTNKARYVCSGLGLQYKRNVVFRGALVKSNGPGDEEVKTLIRTDGGLLMDVTEELKKIKVDPAIGRQMLLDDIAKMAKHGRPFTMTGAQSGIIHRKHELQEDLGELGEKRLLDWIKEMLKQGLIVKARIGGGQPQFLDLPNGPIAQKDETLKPKVCQ